MLGKLGTQSVACEIDKFSFYFISSDAVLSKFHLEGIERYRKTISLSLYAKRQNHVRSEQVLYFILARNHDNHALCLPRIQFNIVRTQSRGWYEAISIFTSLCIYYHFGLTEHGWEFLVVTCCDSHRLCLTFTEVSFGYEQIVSTGLLSNC